MKVLQIGIVFCVFALNLNLCIAEDGAAVVYNRDSFSQDKGKLPLFVKFYAPWCGHCKRMAPAWEELAGKFNNADEQRVVIGKVDCTVETQLCSDNGVTGYPTIKYFADADSEGEKYKGQRDVDALSKFVNNKLGSEAEEEDKPAAGGPPEQKDGLYVLTTDNYDAFTAKGNHFIKFYAPWCGHCKRLAPTWDDLAKKFKDSDDVKISKIDCTENQAACSKNEVRGYPTLLFFKDGKLWLDYFLSLKLERLHSMAKRLAANDTRIPTEHIKKVQADKPGGFSHFSVCHPVTGSTMLKPTLEQAEKLRSGLDETCESLATEVKDYNEEMGIPFVHGEIPQGKPRNSQEENMRKSQEVGNSQEKTGDSHGEEEDEDAQEEEMGNPGESNSNEADNSDLQEQKAERKASSDESTDSSESSDIDKKKETTTVEILHDAFISASRKLDAMDLRQLQVERAKEQSMLQFSRRPPHTINPDSQKQKPRDNDKKPTNKAHKSAHDSPRLKEKAASTDPQDRQRLRSAQQDVIRQVYTAGSMDELRSTLRLLHRRFNPLQVLRQPPSEKYSGGRDLDSLAGFVKKQTGAGGEEPAQAREEAEAEVTKDGMIVLTSANIKETLGSEKTTFVKFYAPWCGHCKHMAGEWAKMGKKYENSKGIQIAKMDCTAGGNREACGEYGVQGFPTLKIFRKGEEVVNHRQGRDLSSMSQVLEENALDGQTEGAVEPEDKPAEDAAAAADGKDKTQPEILDLADHKRLYHQKPVAYKRRQSWPIDEDDDDEYEDTDYEYEPLIEYDVIDDDEDEMDEEDIVSGNEDVVTSSGTGSVTIDLAALDEVKDKVKVTEESGDNTVDLSDFNIEFVGDDVIVNGEEDKEEKAAGEEDQDDEEDDENDDEEDDDVEMKYGDDKFDDDDDDEELEWMGDWKGGDKDNFKSEEEMQDDEEEDDDAGMPDLDQEQEEMMKESLEVKEDGISYTKSGLAVLTDATLGDVIASTKTTFVKFYAPWCGHCKRLAPEWEKLAEAYKGKESVVIAKVDCTENQSGCGKYGVNGYPTLKIFRAGKELGEHNGGRSLELLKEFVDKNFVDEADLKKDEL